MTQTEAALALPRKTLGRTGLQLSIIRAGGWLG